MSNTQLTTADGYNIKNMIFSEAHEGSVPGTTPPIRFKRIIIQTKNADGTIGDLIIPTENVFSLGVCENFAIGTKTLNGYVLPLALWNKDAPTKQEKIWTDTFTRICETCVEHLVKVRKDIGKYDLEARDLKKFNPLYFKKDPETHQIAEGASPLLYCKLLFSKKNDKIFTMFYDTSGEEVDPVSLMGKFCMATAAIKIESIFIGSTITSLQVKMYECEIEPVEGGMKRMMKQRPDSSLSKLKISNDDPLQEYKSKDSDNDSIKDSDNEEDEEEKEKEKEMEKVVPEKKVRRIRKVVNKE
jgi:hypothetical protein